LTVTGDSRTGLGPLGRRLLVAFVIVALSSVIVLTLAALIGTARGLTAGEDAQRQSVVTATASAAADAYRTAGNWGSADLTRVRDIAAAAGAGVVVRDANGTVVSTETAMVQGNGMQGNGQQGGGQGSGQGGQGAGRGGIVAPVVVDGTEVGTVRVGFGSPSTSTAQSIAWTWILAAAVVALIVAFAVAWYVSRRISRPLVRLSNVARSFAAGDHAVRASAEDIAAPGELGELARAFDTTAGDVARSELTRRRMAADIAHELRTPLAALQAGLEELRDGLVEPDGARLSALHDQSLRLGRVVNDLAELSAAETAALTLHRGRVDVGVLVVDAVSAARPALDAAGVRVIVNVASGVVVDGDADRLHQAVGNLLANAARYCREGDSVTVTVASGEGLAVIRLADTGPGIAQVDLPHVFDRLWRGSADTEVAGSGIGLAVVRELVTAHGGTVDAVSDGPTGAVFTIRIPLAAMTPRPPA
jgi:two-component system sensor histidine kinase BaeS